MPTTRLADQAARRRPSLVLPQPMIDRARGLVDRWLPTYPYARPWVDDKARDALRRSEDGWLDRFRDADALTREQVRDLIDWKWTGCAARKSKSWRGVDADWGHSSGCIARVRGPFPGRMQGDSQDADAPGRVLDHGQHMGLGAAGQFGGEEVARQDRVGPGAQELRPGRPGSARRGTISDGW